MAQIKNPILPGFHPDPSILRVGDEVYIATSTFEWFPGVRLHRSEDLATWIPAGHVLDRVDQLDMKGVPDSCGVWAPCLSHDGEQFHLVYSVVTAFDGPFKDTPNFVVSAPSIDGPWSEPTFLSAAGFDGSLFHDEDGRSWYLSMRVDHRGGKFFGGIIAQEWDRTSRSLVGEELFLTEGTKLGITEGPHIYRRGAWLYLVLAEGGTEYGHAVSVLRAKSMSGPWEEHPANPIISAREDAGHPLQKAGHASFLEMPDGEWYATFLVGRPDTPNGRCFLGRETAIERIEWRNDWPWKAGEGCMPRLQLEEGSGSTLPEQSIAKRDETSPEDWQTLRIPADETWCRRDGTAWLLRGRESLGSTHRQSMVARRIQHFKATVSVGLDFSPTSFQHMAGIVLYYNTGHYHYLHVTWDEARSCRCASILTCDNHAMHEPTPPVLLETDRPISLEVELDYPTIQFAVRTGDEFVPIGPALNASILSDDHVREGGIHYRAAFTGPFVGMCCQDLDRRSKWARFSDFQYTGRD